MTRNCSTLYRSLDTAAVIRFLLSSAALLNITLTELCFATPNGKSGTDSGAGIVVDAVIASVDEKPITLKELQARLSPPRKLSLHDLPSDQEAQQTLDLIISERVFEAEATAKRVSVTDAEVEDYINEVAGRNSLTRKDFEAVLTKEGKSVDWYRRQVKHDITKTKIASTLSQGGVSVTEQEIDDYLSANSSSKPEGASVKLRMISIPSAGKTADQLAEKVKSVETALVSGDEFAQVAKKYSEGPHAADGGLLGTVSEKDLSSHIFDAILSLEPGHYSKTITTESESQIFFVEERFGSSGESEESDDEDGEKARREEARKAIQKRKTDEKLSTYFSVELQKNHAVDKKF